MRVIVINPMFLRLIPLGTKFSNSKVLHSYFKSTAIENLNRCRALVVTQLETSASNHTQGVHASSHKYNGTDKPQQL